MFYRIHLAVFTRLLASKSARLTFPLFSELAVCQVNVSLWDFFFKIQSYWGKAMEARGAQSVITTVTQTTVAFEPVMVMSDRIQC